MKFHNRLYVITGSAKYLQEKELLETQAEVTLHYISRTIQQKLPYGYPIKNNVLEAIFNLTF